MGPCKFRARTLASAVLVWNVRKEATGRSEILEVRTAPREGESQIGVLQVGYLADIIAVSGLAMLQNLSFVMKSE